MPSFENEELPKPNKTWDYPRYIYDLCVKKTGGNPLIFELKLNEESDHLEYSDLIVAESPKTEQLDIPIPKNCIIEIRLCKDLNWRWNDERAIGRGLADVDNYFDLKYWDEGTQKWVSPVKGCKYMRIQFSAKVDKKPLKKHPINYNVMLEYPDNKVLPIALDPDIQNPKA